MSLTSPTVVPRLTATLSLAGNGGVNAAGKATSTKMGGGLSLSLRKTVAPLLTPADDSVALPMLSSEPPNVKPCDAEPTPVIASKVVFRESTVAPPEVDSVTTEPCLPCSAAGSATLTVNGLDGAAPERLDPTEPPFTTPNEPSVALELRVLPLPLLRRLS